jgi:DnaK suppressor protein
MRRIRPIASDVDRREHGDPGSSDALERVDRSLRTHSSPNRCIVHTANTRGGCDAGWVAPTSPLDQLRDTCTGERIRLERQIDALTRRFDDIVEAATLTSTDDEHDPEGATIAYERAQVRALLRQARADLAALEATVAQLDAGGVPTCTACSGMIHTDRLLALPGVRTCIECAR